MPRFCNADFAKMANTIRHQGIVESTNGYHVQVRIVQISACATCSINGHCTTADAKEKLIDVFSAQTEAYQPGDSVWVVGQLSMGWWAVILAFLIPLVLLVGVLFVAHALTGDDLRSVGITIPVLAAYYFVLWLFRHKMSRKFAFYIEKQ